LVEPLKLQGHGMLKSAMGANALLVVPEDSPPLAEGTWLETLLLVE
jgi:molybdopterin molybdotransferase